MEKRVRDVVHKAFWDKLEEELSHDPPVFNQALSLMGEVKEVHAYLGHSALGFNDNCSLCTNRIFTVHCTMQVIRNSHEKHNDCINLIVLSAILMAESGTSLE